MRSIQRYGRLGRRSGNVPEEALESRDKIKEAKYIYLSIDEAGTHVGVRCFRYASSPMLSADRRRMAGACIISHLQVACNLLQMMVAEHTYESNDAAHNHVLHAALQP